MGTVIFETADTVGKVIADEFAPYNVRMFTLSQDSAAVCVVVPITDENRDSLAKVYDFTEGADRVFMGVVIKHEGTLSARHRAGQVRSVSIKIMSEDMGPVYTGGATAQFLDTLTPLRDAAEIDGSGYSPLASAHNWRCAAYRAMLRAA